MIAVASTPEKQEACLEAGADVALPYDGLRETLKQTHGRGVDVVFDPVGGPAFDTAARAMARNGRLLVVGFALGRDPEASGQPCAAQGVFAGRRVLGRVSPPRSPTSTPPTTASCSTGIPKGLIFPRIDERRPLSQAAMALQRILDRGAIGKTILFPEG